jgi:hypothetical protein
MYYHDYNFDFDKSMEDTRADDKLSRLFDVPFDKEFGDGWEMVYIGSFDNLAIDYCFISRQT